ncbi:hypothetical protein GALL_547460 [mine drainage metagenome]|uniref:Uncharacterized protein n=1 Tax=mine drainage metagenome TaxID=410659 RepID=A0A1J5NY89_9ZZZZ
MKTFTVMFLLITITKRNVSSGIKKGLDFRRNAKPC